MRFRIEALVLAVLLLPVPAVCSLQLSVDNLFLFTRDAINQLGNGKMGNGLCLRAGPVANLGGKSRLIVFGESLYQDFGEVDGTFVIRNKVLVNYSSRPWLVFGGFGSGIEWELSRILLAGMEVSGGWMRYSCPLNFSSSQSFVRPGHEPESGSSVSYGGDSFYIQVGADIAFRLIGHPQKGKPGPAEHRRSELILKIGFNYCHGGRLECLQRDSFRTPAQAPLSFESSSAPLSQTHFRVGLGYRL